MLHPDSKTCFNAKLLRPADQDDEASWAFVVLPREVSEKLPRRGRTSVMGSINAHPFQATLEPDGQLSHWLKIGEDLQSPAGVKAGEIVSIEIAPMEQEPEPEMPQDLLAAMNLSPEARQTWDDTTTIARLDWIHWITTAKQSKTRAKRVSDACEMLAGGKKRVCCFDPSGYYSKAFRAPEATS